MGVDMPPSFPTLIAALGKPLSAMTRSRRLKKNKPVAHGRRRNLMRRYAATMRLAEMAEEIAGIGHFRRDLRTDRAIWSDQIYRILGLEPGSGALPLGPLLSLFHPDDQQRVADCVRSGIDNAHLFAVEARLIRPDGEVRRVALRGAPELDHNGVVRATFGVFMDVTDAYQAQAELRDSEARFRLLAENASDLIVQTDLNAKLTYISQSVQTATGYSPEELLGRESLSLIHPDDVPAVRAAAEAALSGQPSRRVECRVLDRQGRTLWFEARPAALRDPATGNLCGITDVLRDVTERKAMEAELMQARREAEDAAKVKAEFLANMSHELRTPLTSIVGFSNLLREQEGLGADAERYVERVASASQALLTLVNDILDFSKLEAGEVMLKARPVPLRALLEEALALLQPQADAKDVALTLDLHPSLPERVVADPDRMRQVLLNLIGNAVKFTERGRVSLCANYDSSTETLHCEVRDTGAGIAPDQLRRLFVRFAQVDGSTSRAHGGTGLGLAISKALVDVMGGRMGVTSQPGHGSRFWFEIPLAKATDKEAAAPACFADSIPAQTARLLVVDDHQSNRDLACAILAPLGCELVEASDGESAVAVAATQAFDLILMDVRMPGLDGPGAVRAIRSAEGPNRRTPILAFTADAAEEDCASLAAAGFDDRVLKPVTPTDLIASVTTWLSSEAEPPASMAKERAA